MGLFDKMKQAASAAGGNQTVTFTFQELPESLAQMQALPEASLDTPFKTAALTVCALCAYGADKNIGKEMLNWLRGPRPLNGQDISFLNDRFRDGKSYIPFSYFVGASPENGYERAVKLRKMTDDKLVEHIDHIREEAYNTGYSEAEAQRASTPAPGKTLPQLLEQLDAGECKGIKSATAYKIAEFAREQGYLE